MSSSSFACKCIKNVDTNKKLVSHQLFDQYIEESVELNLTNNNNNNKIPWIINGPTFSCLGMTVDTKIWRKKKFVNELKLKNRQIYWVLGYKYKLHKAGLKTSLDIRISTALRYILFSFFVSFLLFPFLFFCDATMCIRNKIIPRDLKIETVKAEIKRFA